MTRIIVTVCSLYITQSHHPRNWVIITPYCEETGSKYNCCASLVSACSAYSACMWMAELISLDWPRFMQWGRGCM